MADKTATMSITMPESIANELKDLAFDTEQSRSAIITHCLAMHLPVLRKHPMLIKYCEFEAVTQHFSGSSKAA